MKKTMPIENIEFAAVDAALKRAAKVAHTLARKTKTPCYIWEVDNKETVEQLISYGADVNVEDNRGETALSIAESKGHSDIVQLLEQSGAK